MGGTCRDPIAKAITDHLLDGRKPGIIVKAAGILKGHSRGASAAARAVVNERLGFDVLKNHRSTKLSNLVARRAKLILTMSIDNKKQILKANPEFSSKVYTLKEFFGLCGEIKNPFVENDLLSVAAMSRYNDCFDELEELLMAPGNMEKLYDAVLA